MVVPDHAPFGLIMRYSILHLSDLHRDLTDEIPNDWLIDSIERDLDVMVREDHFPPRPSVCVVSGDLVYGVLPTTPDAAQELERQNEQALEFLVAIADRFFKGDRDKVVILPGNHDVAYPKVSESSIRVPQPSTDADRAKLVKQYFASNSNLRWSWPELSFYRISDASVYADRLASFADLYSKFYLGRRSYSLNPEDQFDVFDYPNLKLSLLALCSCHGNDPWQRAGRIHPKALTHANRQLRSPMRSGWLLASAWHHNLTGGPSQDDYLDPRFLQLLIDSGVSLGMHGHQHRTEWFDERYRLGSNNRRMVITSAATLCAGPSNLSPGSPRGYNILEIDNEAWKGRLHQRQMVNLQFDMPVWGPGHFVDTHLSYVDFELSPPLLERPAGLDLQVVLEAADVHLGMGDWKRVLEILAHHMDNALARKMCVKAMEELDDAAVTKKILTNPQTAQEAVLLGDAIFRNGAADEINRYLDDPFVTASTDASVLAMVSRIKKRTVR